MSNATVRLSLVARRLAVRGFFGASKRSSHEVIPFHILFLSTHLTLYHTLIFQNVTSI